MTEYIEREATYEDFEKCNSENPKWTPSRVKALIARQKTADVSLVSHGRWIPVTERLPEPKHEFNARNWYLVALSNGVVKELAYEFHNHSVFGYGWRETAYPVTHWMELPKPPKGE